MAQVEAQLRRDRVEFSDSRLECDRDEPRWNWLLDGDHNSLATFRATMVGAGCGGHSTVWSEVRCLAAAGIRSP